MDIGGYQLELFDLLLILGVPVSTQLPTRVHDFMKLYRSVRTNVEYIR